MVILRVVILVILWERRSPPGFAFRALCVFPSMRKGHKINQIRSNIHARLLDRDCDRNVREYESYDRESVEIFKNNQKCC
jgi:hypothetical protein